MGLSAEEQEAYVLGRIEDNFSNYSAWHERTRVLQDLNTQRPTLTLAELLAADSKDPSTSAAADPIGNYSNNTNFHEHQLLLHDGMHRQLKYIRHLSRTDAEAMPATCLHACLSVARQLSAADHLPSCWQRRPVSLQRP